MDSQSYVGQMKVSMHLYVGPVEFWQGENVIHCRKNNIPNQYYWNNSTHVCMYIHTHTQIEDRIYFISYTNKLIKNFKAIFKTIKLLEENIYFNQDFRRGFNFQKQSQVIQRGLYYLH